MIIYHPVFPMGLEPMTPNLKDSCSANWAKETNDVGVSSFILKLLEGLLRVTLYEPDINLGWCSVLSIFLLKINKRSLVYGLLETWEFEGTKL